MSYKNDKGEVVQCQPSWNLHDGHFLVTRTRVRRGRVYQGFVCMDCGRKSRNWIEVGSER